MTLQDQVFDNGVCLDFHITDGKRSIICYFNEEEVDEGYLPERSDPTIDEWIARTLFTRMRHAESYDDAYELFQEWLDIEPEDEVHDNRQ